MLKKILLLSLLYSFKITLIKNLLLKRKMTIIFKLQNSTIMLLIIFKTLNTFSKK